MVIIARKNCTFHACLFLDNVYDMKSIRPIRAKDMTRRISSFLMIFVVVFTFNSQPSFAIGKTEWWTNNVTGSWWKNGITCWTDNSDVRVGTYIRISYLVGQSKKWNTLETVQGIPGDTLVNSQGEQDDSEDSFEACDDGASAVAVILTKMPGGDGGSYLVKYDNMSISGKKFLWSTTNKVLGAYTGIQTTSAFFTNPPKVVLPNYVYENLPPSLGIKAYTQSGKPRHACLIFYDLVLKSFKNSDESVYSKEIVNSAQGGWLGANIRQTMGTSGGTIQTAIKCAPWIAEYLW